MTIHPSLYSSASEEWPTPQAFFDELNKEFGFTLDPCATKHNHKCPNYFTKSEDGLSQDWGRHRVFANPPYGRRIIEWAHKCYDASQDGALVVLLVHARTDTRWFHEWVYGKAELRFVKGRLKFGDGKQSAPFPSLVAVYRPPLKLACAQPSNGASPGEKGKTDLSHTECEIRQLQAA